MRMPVRLHLEDPALFREALRFTAAETGFSFSILLYSNVICRKLAFAWVT